MEVDADALSEARAEIDQLKRNVVTPRTSTNAG